MPRHGIRNGTRTTSYEDIAFYSSRKNAKQRVVDMFTWAICQNPFIGISILRTNQAGNACILWNRHNQVKSHSLDTPRCSHNIRRLLPKALHELLGEVVPSLRMWKGRFQTPKYVTQSGVNWNRLPRYGCLHCWQDGWSRGSSDWAMPMWLPVPGERQQRKILEIYQRDIFPFMYKFQTLSETVEWRRMCIVA